MDKQNKKYDNDYNRNIPYTIKNDERYIYKPLKCNYEKYLLINSNVIVDTNCLIYNLELIKK